jgi:Lon protease-like protein
LFWSTFGDERMMMMMMMLLLIFALQQHAYFCLGRNAGQKLSLGFVVAPTTARHQRTASTTMTTTRLFDVPYEHGFNGGNRKKKEMQKKDKNPMDIVRSLQESFYTSEITMANTPQTTFRNGDGSIIENLPLWQVPWTEVPGRSNILHVHDAIYTNMFEQVLRRQPAHHTPAWYIGHLYLPPSSAQQQQQQQQGSSRTLQNPNQRHQLLLRAWNDPAVSSTSSREEEVSESATATGVLGTLLRITDYRRLVDGRLILLVQAMERFTVTSVQQHVPYGMATVQLLPDMEEVDDDFDSAVGHKGSWVHQRTERDVAPARALALQESFQKWHVYEYETTLLPLPGSSSTSNDYLEESDLAAPALATVLPFAPYSSTMNVASLAAAESMDEVTFSLNVVDDAAEDGTAHIAHIDMQDETTTTATLTTPTLEQRLMNMGILLNETTTSSFMRNHHHPIDPSLLKMSVNELEFRLWWALNDFLKTTRTPVSPILLGLLPPLSIWDVYMDEYGSVDDIVIIAGMKNDDIVDSESVASSSSFVLHRIAQAIQQQTQLQHKYVAVDEAYPALRRQKRLSYAAAYVLESALNNPDAVTSLRQVLLQIPSTRQRLAFVYQRLQQTEALWGAFQ